MDLQLLPIFAQSSQSNCAFLPRFGDVSFLGSLPASWCTERSRQLSAAPGATAQSQHCRRALGGRTLHRLPITSGQSPWADLTHASRQVMGMKQERAAEATRGWHLLLKLQDPKDRPSASPLQLRDPEHRPQLCSGT